MIIFNFRGWVMCRKWETPYLGSSPIRWGTKPLAGLQCATSRIRKSRPRVPSNSRLRSPPRSIKDSAAGVPFVARLVLGAHCCRVGSAVSINGSTNIGLNSEDQEIHTNQSFSYCHLFLQGRPLDIRRRQAAGRVRQPEHFDVDPMGSEGKYNSRQV